MKRILLATTAAMATMTGAAMAETTAEQVIAGLQAQGFTEIEVTTGPTQVKVEASGGGQELEYVYDRLTGKVLMQEFGPDDDEDDEGPEVEIDTSDEDFLDGDEDLEGEDDDKGHGNDPDGFDADNPGKGNFGGVPVDRDEEEEEEREEREEREEEEREEREEREEEEREEREEREEEEEDDEEEEEDDEEEEEEEDDED